MTQSLHTIIGAKGAIGQSVKNELQKRSLPVRLVSRSITDGKETRHADLLDLRQTIKATEGSTHIYLCAGIEYSSKAWEEQWEYVMKNTIAACEEHQSRLIFLDNVYMYAQPLPIPFDEATTQSPSSRKGAVRKKVADLMVNAINENRIRGLIGRSADFFGPGATNSMFYISYLENMLKGKAPMALSPIDVLHTYANTIDVGRALVALALEEDCYQQVWHLPVGEPITIEQMQVYFDEILEKKFTVKPLPNFFRKLLSLFIPALRELDEMMYQFENKYVMSFEKFSKRFPDFALTDYREVVRQKVEWFQK